MAPDDKEADPLEAETLEGEGFIVDDQGNRWAVPSENVDDLSDIRSMNPMDFPRKDPRFWYQWVRDDQYPAYVAMGCAGVLRSEVGFSPHLTKEYGGQQDTLLRAGGMVVVKIPMQYASRLQEASERDAKEAMEALGPTEKMLEQAERAGVKTVSSAKKRTSGRLTQ